MRLGFRLGIAVARFRRLRRSLLEAAGHEAGRGNVVTASVLLVLYAVS